MADVITRFKLETTQYDSKLRDETKRLAEITRQASKAGNEFKNFTQKNVEAARALGNMTPSANNAKDKVKELVSAFNDAAKAYNALTKEQQQSDFGKALAQSIGQLSDKIKEAKQELYGMGDAVKKAGGGGLFGGMGDKMSGALQVFAGNMLTKAAGAVANLGSEIADMVKQGVEMAKAGEGIRNAFERLGRGDILDGLRQATHGTVTDLELMKAAVKFNDFKLPLEELGTMLAFAQQKAKDTGQSVDYMVDSIVTGLGRKSLMILDNLGLSAAEIKEKMAETGDMTKAVGEIIREQMSQAGDYIETAADRATKADVDLKNAMEELGRTFQPLSDAGTSMFKNLEIGALNLLNNAIKPLINALTAAGRMRTLYSAQSKTNNAKIQEFLAGLSNSEMPERQHQINLAYYDKQINSFKQYLADYKTWQKDKTAVGAYDRMQAFTKSTGLSMYSDVQEQMEVIKKQKTDYANAAKDFLNTKVNIDTTEAIQSLDGLNKKLKELQEQRKKAIAAGDTDLSKNLAKQIRQVKYDIRGLGGSITNKTTTKTVKTEEQLNNDEIQKLTQEYIKASDDRRKAIEGEIKNLQDRNAEIKRLMEAAQGKVAPDGSLKALSEELSKLQQERQLLSDPIAIEIQDQAIKDVQDEIDRLNGKKVEVELEVDDRTPFEKLKDSLKIEIAEQNLQVDTNTLQTLMKTAIQNGIDGLDPEFSTLQEKLREGINIHDETWQALQDQINARLQELNIDPIKIDFKTGNIEKTGKETEKSWQAAAQAVQSVNSALQGLEEPGAKIMGIIGQAIAQIALGFAQATEADSKFGVLGWIAAITGGIATMTSTIAAIHSATGYANGGIVKGNSYSGDNIPAMIDGGAGGFAGLNAGEIVLNKSAQGNLASQLQDIEGRGGYTPSHISGEQIWIAINRYTKRTGRGELVTWK